MTEVIDSLKEGDVYRWRYRGPDVDLRQYGSYHCCSCIAIVHNGLLRDTFWQIGNTFSDCKTFGVTDLHKIDLTYLGNLADLVKAPEYQADYYDDADIVNLSHSNSSRDNFYLRKGAKRSQAKMLQSARERMEKCLADARWASEKAQRLSESIARITSGDLDTHIG